MLHPLCAGVQSPRPVRAPGDPLPLPHGRQALQHVEVPLPPRPDPHAQPGQEQVSGGGAQMPGRSQAVGLHKQAQLQPKPLKKNFLPRCF